MNIMKYFEYFDLPNWREVTEKALAYYFERRDEYIKSQANPVFKFADTEDILEKIPEFKTMLEPVNATVKQVWFFELPENVPVEKGMHSDGAKHESRFLLPLRNCERTETRYYTSNQPLILLQEVYDKELSAPAFPVENSCTHVATMHLERGPVLMRTNQIHSVYMPEDAILPRMSMLLDVNEDLTYLLD